MHSQAKVNSEIASKASFEKIRYGQCWEDADIVIEAMNLQPDDVVLSICSAGDNTLAILAKNPAKVIAIDLSSAQLACLELRVAAYKTLEYEEVLSLMGCSENHNRRDLYRLCRGELSATAQAFWDEHQTTIDLGLCASGKFESYFSIFRNVILPLVHNTQEISNLIHGGTLTQRQAFYDKTWNTWQWRTLFKLFFSRFMMGLLGRHPSFFQYAEGDIYSFLMNSTRHALTALNPSANPYLQWILTGQFKTSLPFSLRRENFEAIKANLDRLEWRKQSLEEVLDDAHDSSSNLKFDAFNLSDVFEYMSQEAYETLLKKLVRRANHGARLVYWNMMANRRRPEFMSTTLKSLNELANHLYKENKTFFYTRFVVEEVVNA